MNLRCAWSGRVGRGRLAIGGRSLFGFGLPLERGKLSGGHELYR